MATENNIAANADVAQQIDINTATAIERIDNWLDGFIRLLPNIVVALMVLAVMYGLSLLVQKMVISGATSRGRENLGRNLGGLMKWIVIVVGVMLAATIVVPSLKPGDLIAGLGVSSVAIGFAFKDILQNWLAGLLILMRQPFEVDDQIEINGFEGSVERIETRATIIKTYDGQRVVIPNSDIYTTAVLVKTAYKTRRSQYDLGIGYLDNIDEACEIIEQTIKSIDGVEKDPAPQALPWDLAASWVTIRMRWWTNSRRADVVKVHARVMQQVKEALDKAGIDMPYETSVQLFHDQTEAEDGNRKLQREGWPNTEETKPRWQAALESSDKSKVATS